MIREDYLMRMIEEIGVLIRRILNRRISPENVEIELEKLADRWIGLPANLLLSLPVNHVFRLFEDSERMVIEKSYLMGEVFRAKGFGSESNEAKFEFYEKALFFYDKCNGLVPEKLQSEIDSRLSELDALIKARPGQSLASLIDDSLEELPLPAPIPRSRVQNRKTKRKAAIFWYAIAVCAIASLVYSLLGQDAIEISDKTLSFQNNSAHVQFRIANHTAEDRLIRLRFSAERYTSGTFNSGYAFLGAIEREYSVGPDSSENISELFDFPGNTSGPNLSVSIEILSNQSAESP